MKVVQEGVWCSYCPNPGVWRFALRQGAEPEGRDVPVCPHCKGLIDQHLEPGAGNYYVRQLGLKTINVYLDQLKRAGLKKPPKAILRKTLGSVVNEVVYTLERMESPTLIEEDPFTPEEIMRLPGRVTDRNDFDMISRYGIAALDATIRADQEDIERVRRYREGFRS